MKKVKGAYSVEVKREWEPEAFASPGGSRLSGVIERKYAPGLPQDANSSFRKNQLTKKTQEGKGVGSKKLSGKDV